MHEELPSRLADIEEHNHQERQQHNPEVFLIPYGKNDHEIENDVFEVVDDERPRMRPADSKNAGQQERQCDTCYSAVERI
ncbi:hypothetical protein DSECCO2_486590 [anaerobic digester metagenome]